MTSLRRLWFFLTRRWRQAELDEEMRLHIELRAARHRRDGLAPDDAARAARVHFGDPLKLREEGRDAWGFVLVDRLARDVRDAVRHLVRRPMWTATVVLTLALGVGANTSIFTLVDTLLFRPGTGADPGRLVWIFSVEASSGHIVSMSYPHYVAYRDRARTLTAIAAVAGTQMAVGGPMPDRVYGELASANYFDVFGVHPALGRAFVPADDTPDAAPVAVLADTFWHTHFAGDPAIVNHTVAVNGEPVTIVGVAPPGFTGEKIGQDPALWLPLVRQARATYTYARLLDDPTASWLRVVGRLAPGSSIDGARAELAVLASGLSATMPASEKKSVIVAPTTGRLTPGDRTTLEPVLGLLSLVPLLVLVVACANVANLVMARNVDRQREFALRRAIGASRARIVSELGAEAIGLAALAALVGYALSYALTAIVVHVGDVPDEVTQAMRSSGRVVAATAGLALATTVIFGLLPALTATRFDLVSTLKDLGAAVSAGRARRRLRSAFVVMQVALSLALVVAAGLFVRSFTKAMGIDVGFDVRHAVTLSFDPALQRYDVTRRNQFAADLIAKATALHGVTAAGVTTMLPLSGETHGKRVTGSAGSRPVYPYYAGVSSGYFEAMSIPIVSGRAFDATDTSGSTPVAIVNQALARRLWPGQNAIGQHLEEDVTREVVGVARDGRYGSLTDDGSAAFYVPLGQADPRERAPLSLVARTTGDEVALLRSLEDAARTIDPDLPAFQAESLRDLVRVIAAGREAVASLLGVFGLLTLAIAAIGIYGVAAHGAAMRRREVGLRMALGARPADVRRLFIRQSLGLAGVGVAIGCAISLAGSRLLTSFLFGLAPTDALTFAGGALVLVLVAVAASYLPARAAARVNPVVALRQD